MADSVKFQPVPGSSLGEKVLQIKLNFTKQMCVIIRCIFLSSFSTDVNECAVSNGGCSHKCVNTAGGYKCECPDPELSLSSDNKTCHGQYTVLITNGHSFFFSLFYFPFSFFFSPCCLTVVCLLKFTWQPMFVWLFRYSFLFYPKGDSGRRTESCK